MHTYLHKTALQLTPRKGVVKVFGIGRVYGKREDFSKILPLRHLLTGDLRGDLTRSLFGLFGVGIGEIVLCQDSVHLGIVVSGCP